MKYIYFLAVLMIGFCSSCINESKTQQKDQFKKNLTTINIDLDKIVNLQLSDIIGSLEYIPLETKQECYLSNIDKLIWYKDKFFILDQSAKTVFCFSQNGKFLHKIQRVGKGPGEYLGISDIIINPFRNTLEILDRNSRNILCYNLSDLAFINSIQIQHRAKNFIVTNPSSYYLYTMGTDISDGVNDFNYNLFEVDSLGKKLLGKYFKAYQGSSIFGYPSMLSPINDTTALFSYFYNDTIFEINKNTISPKYFINFGKNKLPLENAKLDVDQSIKAFNQNAYACHLNTFFETDKVLYFHYGYKNNTKKVLYYKNKNEFVNFNYLITNDIDRITLGDVMTVSGDHMLFSISPLRIEKLIKEDEKVDSNTKSVFRNINPSDNPILVSAKLK